MVWLLMFKINFTLQIVQIIGLNVYASGFEEKHIWISTRKPWSIIRHDFSFLTVIHKSGLIELIYVLHMRSFDFQHGRYCKQSPRSPKNSIYL